MSIAVCVERKGVVKYHWDPSGTGCSSSAQFPSILVVFGLDSEFGAVTHHN